MERQIPFFNYQALTRADEGALLDIVRDVFQRGAYILQSDVVAFEQAVAKFLQVKHCLGVSDGTNAIILALRAVGIQQGDEIILPSHTFVATASAIHDCGAIPVVVECGEDHLIDPKAIVAAITKKTKVIIPVHLNGRTCQMDAISKIASTHGLLIVEDAAQAFGARYHTQAAGTFGSFGTFSFYPAKSLGCFGDGGALITNNDILAEKVRLMRDHGRDRSGNVQTWGTNSRLDNLQAAILNFRLSRFANDIVRRRQIATHYHQGLAQIKQLVLPPPPSEDGIYFDTYQNYEIEAERRDELRNFLKTRGVSTSLQWNGQALHQMHALGMSAKLPYTERLFSRFLLLPMNTFLSNEDVDYIIETIYTFYAA